MSWSKTLCAKSIFQSGMVSDLNWAANTYIFAAKNAVINLSPHNRVNGVPYIAVPKLKLK
jgi:hypothetical protein